MSSAADEAVRSAQYGEFERLVNLVTQHGPFLADKDGCSLLHWAAINNRMEIAKYLISQCQTDEERNRLVNCVGGTLKETPLMWCARNGNYTYMVKLLLDSGADVHHKNNYGHNALFLSCQSGHLHIAYLLLACGRADPNASNDLQNMTPLSWLIDQQSQCHFDCLDLVRLLINFNADVNQLNMPLPKSQHDDLEGGGEVTSFSDGEEQRSMLSGDTIRANNFLHKICSQPSVRGKYQKIDFQLIYLLLTTRNGSNLLNAKNREGYTPFQMAKSARNLGMLRFFYDYYMYNHYPRIIPTLATALCIFLFFPILHYCGWMYGLIIFVPLCYGCDALSQSTLHHDSSRLNFGISWGIIASIAVGHFVYVAPYISIWWTLLGVLPLLVTIVVTLILASTTSPVSLSKTGNDIYDDKHLEERLVQSGISEGPLGGGSITNQRQHVPTDEKARLCSSCLVDKSRASTHCSRCGLCVVALDHHCAFVNNCVGRGNRRIFVMFTFFASLGCALCAILSLYVQYTASAYCSYIAPSLWNLFSVQMCVARKDLSFVALLWLSILSSTWIGSICITQLSFISSGTTSYLIMKGLHDGSCDLCTSTGLRNLLLFVQTGNYIASPNKRAGHVTGMGDEEPHPLHDTLHRRGSSDKKEEDQEEGLPTKVHASTGTATSKLPTRGVMQR